MRDAVQGVCQPLGHSRTPARNEMYGLEDRCEGIVEDSKCAHYDYCRQSEEDGGANPRFPRANDEEDEGGNQEHGDEMRTDRDRQSECRHRERQPAGQAPEEDPEVEKNRHARDRITLDVTEVELIATEGEEEARGDRSGCSRGRELPCNAVVEHRDDQATCDRKNCERRRGRCTAERGNPGNRYCRERLAIKGATAFLGDLDPRETITE